MPTDKAMRLPCRKCDIVAIVWEDAVGESTRHYREELEKLQTVVNINIGWIGHEDDRRIVLCHGTSTSDQVDTTTIPIANVLKRIWITPRRKSRADEAKEEETT